MSADECGDVVEEEWKDDTVAVVTLGGSAAKLHSLCCTFTSPAEIIRNMIVQ